MNAKLLSRWEVFRFNFWFIPLVMIVMTVVLAVFTLWLDATIPPETLGGFVWVYVGGSDRSLFLLSVMAGAMVTVAALVFTITVVALTLASSQYGHRLLRTYISDPGNQAVTGMFICTFIYCVIVLHSATGLDEVAPTPHVSISVAGLLAFISLGMLIYYLHHASTSLQVEIFAARLGHNLIREIRRQYPEHPVGTGCGHEPDPGRVAGASRTTVPSSREGYIRFIDYPRLMKLATRHGALIRVYEETGRFIIPGKPLVEIYAERPVPSGIDSQINGCFWTGPMRNLSQDIRYGVDQLVEVALRALSVNAPFTAMGCIEWIGAALSILARREEAHPCLYDDEGRIRVIRKMTGFEEMVSSAFDQLRQFSYEVPGVSIRMLDVIALVMSGARKAEYRQVLLRHAEMIEQGKAALPEARDREELSRRFRRIAEIAAEA
jgi:uncharacterized membrane protein